MNPSWLDPNGNFYPIQYSHTDWAWDRGETAESLWALGWMRITFIGDIIYIHNGLKQLPNRRQKSSVVDIAIEDRRFNLVVYDNNEKEIVIWNR